MRPSKTIEGTISHAVTTLQSSLRLFHPAQNKNGFNERNLSYYFCNAFSSTRQQGCVFMEPPFLGPKERYDRHIDSYVFDRNIGILIESKRLYNNIKCNEIAHDFNVRLTPENALKILELHTARQPNKVYGLVLVEAWGYDIERWWMTGESGRKTWDRSCYPTDAVFRSKYVGDYPQGSLLWLYAYKQLL